MKHETVVTQDSLTIATTFRTSPDRLYACWTESDHLAAWAGPGGYTSSAEIFEPRPGARHLAKMRGSDGTSTRTGGIYKVTDPGARLVYSQGWLAGYGSRETAETTVTVTSAPTEKGTLMVFHQAGFASKPSRDGHETGRPGSFNHLDVYLSVAQSASREQ